MVLKIKAKKYNNKNVGFFRCQGLPWHYYIIYLKKLLF